ncbi:MAG: CoA transferase [Alphaproteobacteria bacterium]
MSDDAMLLDGLKVIDAASFIAGPVAATVLADFGADVIKIEAPGGDGYRNIVNNAGMPAERVNYAWQVDNRSKRGICLDLAAEEGQAILHQLLAGADVLVTNFLPRVRDKLGLTADALLARYPRLIYASMSAYGEVGPEAHKTGFDSTALWARTGLMDLVKPEPDATPARSLPGMGDHPTGISLLAAILLGLYKRERTGNGSHVSTSLVANGIWMNAFYAQAALNGAAIPPRPHRDAAPNPMTNHYQCKDSRWFILAAVNEEREATEVFKAIGREDLLADPRFADKPSRRANAAALTKLLDETFVARDWNEWREILGRHRITFGPVGTLDDLAGDGTLRDAGALVPDGAGGLTVGSPVFMDGEAKRPPQAAPGIGAHSRDILAELGYAESDIERLIAGGVVQCPSF